jgi:hypothetical protein
VDEVGRVEVKPLPVWFLVVFVLLWTGMMTGPALAWGRVEWWTLACGFVVLALLFLLLLLDFRRRFRVAIEWRAKRRRAPSSSLTVLYAMTPVLVVSSSHLPPLLFVGLVLATSVLLAVLLWRSHEGMRADMAAGR